MSDWASLGLDSDPVPGDPTRTRDLAAHLRQQAEQAETNASRLRALAADDGALRMQGDYAPKFREALAELPGEIAKPGHAYRGCGVFIIYFASCL